MKKAIVIIMLVLFLVGCQKYGLSINVPKEDSINNEKLDSEKISSVKIPSTKAIIMKNGDLDLRVIGTKELNLNFNSFNIRLVPDIIDGKSFYRYVMFEPKDFHNDFSLEFELNKKGSPLKETIIQKQNGVIVWGSEIIYVQDK